jgi:hypothetical protein
MFSLPKFTLLKIKLPTERTKIIKKKCGKIQLSQKNGNKLPKFRIMGVLYST